MDGNHFINRLQELCDQFWWTWINGETMFLKGFPNVTQPLEHSTAMEMWVDSGSGRSLEESTAAPVFLSGESSRAEEPEWLQLLGSKEWDTTERLSSSVPKGESLISWKCHFCPKLVNKWKAKSQNFMKFWQACTKFSGKESCKDRQYIVE